MDAERNVKTLLVLGGWNLNAPSTLRGRWVSRGATRTRLTGAPGGTLKRTERQMLELDASLTRISWAIAKLYGRGFLLGTRRLGCTRDTLLERLAGCACLCSKQQHSFRAGWRIAALRYLNEPLRCRFA